MLNKNYINIQGWMLHELKLSGNELLIYAIVYGFSQDGQNTFYGSLSYIETMLNISKNGVRNSLKSLIEKGYIEKVKQSHYKSVSKIDTEGYQKLAQGVSKSDTATVSKIDTNNNNTNNKDNNVSKTTKKPIETLSPEEAEELEEARTLAPQISALIKSFEKIDINNSEYYGRKDMRKACIFLIKNYGYEKTLTSIESIPDLKMVVPFFPSIINPKELKDKWVKAQDAIQRYGVEKLHREKKKESSKTFVNIF